MKIDAADLDEILFRHAIPLNDWQHFRLFLAEGQVATERFGKRLEGRYGDCLQEIFETMVVQKRPVGVTGTEVYQITVADANDCQTLTFIQFPTNDDVVAALLNQAAYLRSPADENDELGPDEVLDAEENEAAASQLETLAEVMKNCPPLDYDDGEVVIVVKVAGIRVGSVTINYFDAYARAA